MINYETILSNFDDKVTLYNWLRKVEEALKNASLESVSVSQQSAGTAVLTFIFADGTSVVSPALTLPQGATGPQGPTGLGITDVSLNGNNAFVITLDNGTTIVTDTMSASRLYCHSVVLATYGPSVNTYDIAIELINDNPTAYTTPMELFNAYKDSNNYTPFFQATGALYDATTQTAKDIYRARLHLVNNVLHLEAQVTGEVQPTLDVLVFPNIIDQCIKLSLAVAKGDTGDTGATGNGIASIALISTLGLVNTYRITFTDGTHFDFDVTNGSSFVNVDGQNIAPANVNATGNISAPSIIEIMNGYSFAPRETPDIAWNPVYVGVVKNGNKSTFVIFGNYTYSTSDSNTAVLGKYTTPLAVYNALVPYNVGGSAVLNQIRLQLFSTASLTDAPKQVNAQITKATAPTLNVSFAGINDAGLVNGTTYNFRIEFTLTTSENLVQ